MAVALVLAGCASPSLQGVLAPAPAAAPTATPPADTTVTAPPPRPEARTVEQFDTTSAQERASALATAPASGERRLGTTVAALGAPTDPGIWIKTPLVSAVTPGRAEVSASGKSANIELRPSGGAAGSGSQISLAAMRLLEVPLTGLPELVLFAR